MGTIPAHRPCRIPRAAQVRAVCGWGGCLQRGLHRGLGLPGRAGNGLRLLLGRDQGLGSWPGKEIIGGGYEGAKESVLQ